MSKPAAAIPRLDLSPRLVRPLSLWNLLDYLRLLYWVFFFPQAIGWYVKKYGIQTLPYGERNWRKWATLIKTDSVQRSLLLQCIILIIVLTTAVAILLVALKLTIHWSFFVGYVGIGIAGGIAFGTALGVSGGVVSVIVFAMLGMVTGVMSGFLWGTSSVSVTQNTTGLMIVGFMLGVALGMIEGCEGEVVYGITWGVARGAAMGVAMGATYGVLRGLAGNGPFVLPEGTPGSILEMTAMGIAVGVGWLLGLARLPDYLLSILPAWLAWRYRCYRMLSRATWLPFTWMKPRLTDWLKQDIKIGIDNLNQVIQFSYQFIPVVQVLNNWLEYLPPLQLLPAVNYLANKPYDWDLVRFGSASLRTAMWRSSVNGWFFLPKAWRERWREQIRTEPRLDTLARAACAGYWYLHERDPKAIEAFGVVRHLPHGEFLYQTVSSIYQALDAGDLKQIAEWGLHPLWSTDTAAREDSLRPLAMATLERLRIVALEARSAVIGISKLNRSAALGRAVAGLTALIEDAETTCSYPEWPLVKQAAEQWRDILAIAAGEDGQIAIKNPVENPFVVGSPVDGKLFVGREEIFRCLEELWGSDPGQRVPSVVLFGHRRMGKSSILQNLGRYRFGVDTLVAQFTMQQVGKLHSTSELLGYLALAIHDTLSEAGITSLQEPELEAFQNGGYPIFNHYLRQVKRAIGARRVVLTIDEFELLEREISAGRADAELLEVLRGVMHSEPWLILALAGLHTLEEMTADYWNPLFASVTSVRVNFLSLEATAQLLANPTDDFPLDFDMLTVERVFYWVRGQPYLTQLVGHTLVWSYNQYVFEEGKKRSPHLTPDDVDAVISVPEFYKQGSPYFTGVWGQAEKSGPPGQIALLQALAASETPQGTESLFQVAGLAQDAGVVSLEVLVRHDILFQDATGLCDFTVPLMRRWINEHARR